MVYIDTDVLINFYITQDEIKHREANSIIEEINSSGLAKISILSIQETLFVLEKLKLEKTKINTVFNELIALNPLTYDAAMLTRAVDLAQTIGFRHINDCIHTAIAETYCTEIITYNKKDFSKIEELTHIKVKIL